MTMSEPRILSGFGIFYVVQKGDTLTDIGHRLGISPQRLASLNRIQNPDLIFPGQLLATEHVRAALGRALRPVSEAVGNWAWSTFIAPQQRALRRVTDGR